MILIRIAAIYIHEYPEQETFVLPPLNHGPLKLSILNVTKVEDQNRLRVTVYVSTSFKTLPHTPPNENIPIDRITLRPLHQLIETYANFLSVARSCQCDVVSPRPHVSFIPENDAQKNWLERSKGIPGLTSKVRSLNSRLPLDSHFESWLLDRQRGVALVAEAHRHQNTTGKFREFMRLFELAFSRAGRNPHKPNLLEPLSEFLMSSVLGYTHAEVDNWIEIRDRTTHQDDVAKPFYLAADVTPVINRVQQAAYDILFNKEVWHDPSVTRRSAFTLTSGTKNSDETLYFAKAGSPVDVTFEVLDGFGVYPLDRIDVEKHEMPPEWWFRISPDNAHPAIPLDPNHFDSDPS